MLKKVIKNKVQTEEQEKNGIIVYPSEEILGSMKKVKEFASFYATHKEDLEIITASNLLGFCKTMNFTNTELDSFRFGLESMLKFFEASYNDTEAYLRQAENNKKTVG